MVPLYQMETEDGSVCESTLQQIRNSTENLADMEA